MVAGLALEAHHGAVVFATTVEDGVHGMGCLRQGWAGGGQAGGQVHPVALFVAAYGLGGEAPREGKARIALVGGLSAVCHVGGSHGKAAIDLRDGSAVAFCGEKRKKWM